MTTKELADLMFPDITKTIEDYEKEYPERPEGTVVTRYAPSPTGFMHIGNFYSVLIDYVIAKRSNGVFFLRNEDTDQAREVEGAVEYIMHVLNHYGLNPDEYEIKGGETVGNYGPYIQSERRPIYKTFIKQLIAEGKAYPCFMTQEEMDVIRDNQAKAKARIGIYGKFAKSRNLTPDEAAEKIKAGEPYTIRFKSTENFNTMFKFNDFNQYIIISNLFQFISNPCSKYYRIVTSTLFYRNKKTVSMLILQAFSRFSASCVRIVSSPLNIDFMKKLFHVYEI